MSFEFGQYNEYSDPVSNANPVILAVAKAIKLGPFKGAFYQSMVAPTVSITTKAFEVYSRSKTSRDGVIGDGATTGWDDSAVTGLAMTAAVLKGLTIGHVLEVENEVVIVKAINRSENTIDVYARGAGGTTAAAHADQTKYKVIGFAGHDTDLKNVTGMNEVTAAYENYVQTIFEVIDWTKHATLVSKGLAAADATTQLVMEAEIRVAEMLSNMAVLGRKQKAVDTSDRYMSAGLLAQLADTNNGNRAPFAYNANGPLTEAKVKAAIEEVISAGGMVDTIWASPANKAIINGFNMASTGPQVTTTRDDHTAGTYISQIDYEGLLINVKVDSSIPDDKLPIVNSADCKKGWLKDDGLRLTDEPTASSREIRKALQGSVGFLIENVGQNHTYLYGITG